MQINRLLLVLLTVSVEIFYAEDAVLARPALIYRPESRKLLLERLSPGKDAWSPSAEDVKSADFTRRTLAEWWNDSRMDANLNGWSEEGRSQKLMNLAMLAWLDPQGARANGEKYLDTIRAAIKKITVPKLRRRDFFPEDGKDPEKQGPWQRYLEASYSLWCYALAYDLLATREIASAGLEPAVLDEMYTRLSDGILHLLVAHLGTYGKDWGKTLPVGNNWNSREFAGAGIALLALRDKFLKEPKDSQRCKDYETGIRIVKQYSIPYLEGWGGKSGAGPEFRYYYESPHYLRYWVEMFMAFAKSYGRAFPDDPWKPLDPDQPIARFMRGHTVLAMPTHTKDGKPQWGLPPIDDSWLYPDTAHAPLLLAAAWIGQRPPDRKLFLNTAKLTGGVGHALLLGDPLLDELAALPPMELPAVQLTSDGLAIARTSGNAASGLSVVIKNTETPLDDKGVPSLWSHNHSDNGQVLAYRNSEPVLIDPGYGPDGYSNKSKTQAYTHWEQHNTLLVADPANGAAFVLPISSSKQPGDRVARCDTTSDAAGTCRFLEISTPRHRRTVIVPDETHLLIVDRLEQASRVKLCWFGNGSVEGRENAGAAKGKPFEGDLEKKPTATIDATAARATYFRGPTLATQISVIHPTEHETKFVPGEYGPWWYAVNYPLTGMHVTSKEKVTFAVTLVEIVEKQGDAAPKFTMTAKIDSDGGRLKSVTLTAGEKARVYVVGENGKISRSQK